MMMIEFGDTAITLKDILYARLIESTIYIYFAHMEKEVSLNFPTEGEARGIYTELINGMRNL